MRLAGERCRNDVHHSSAQLTVEGTYVGPDRGIVEELVFDACLDELLAIRVDFNVANCGHLQSC